MPRSEEIGRQEFSNEFEKTRPSPDSTLAIFLLSFRVNTSRSREQIQEEHRGREEDEEKREERERERIGASEAGKKKECRGEICASFRLASR
jgi:hypothetical protein